MTSSATDETRDVPVVDIHSHTRTIDTQLIAAMAAWLIFNSHLEPYYPRPYMAADGLFGNSLFFLMSGYGIQMSLLGRPQSFFAYYWRRLIRLYPAVMVAVLIFVIGFHGLWRGASPRDYLAYFVYPTPFTYVRNIVPFYVLIYFFGRLRSARAIFAAMMLGLIVYALGVALNTTTDGVGVAHHELSATHVLSRWAQYWLVLCAGAMAAVLGIQSWFSWKRLVMVAALFCLYFGTRAFVILTHRHQVLTIPVDFLVILTCVGVLLTLGSPADVERVRRVPIVGPLIAICGACTLEIFVCGQSLEGLHYFLNVQFPFNIVLLAALTLVSAIILHAICEQIRKRLEGRRPRPVV